MIPFRPLLFWLITLSIFISIWRISLPPALDEEVITAGASRSYHPHQQESFGMRYDGNDGRNGNVKNLKTTFPSPQKMAEHRNLDSYSSSKKLNSLNRTKLFINSLNQQISSAVNYELLPNDDFNRLINLRNFQFSINQKPCRSHYNDHSHTMNDSRTADSYPDVEEDSIKSQLLLVLIHSAPENYKKRLLIRETWGSLNTPLVRMLFLLGSVNSTATQNRIESENRMFSDLVQGNFYDDYHNMTYKHVMAFKWFTYFCPETKFILKADDDIFVNMPNLIEFLSYTVDRRNFMFCQKESWARIKRSYRSKWRVSVREYPGRYYPTYCPGYLIVYSPDVAFRLYLEAQKAEYFWIDDVHITGTLAKRANIDIIAFQPFMMNLSDFLNIENGHSDFNSFKFLFSWPDIQEADIRELWRRVEENS